MKRFYVFKDGMQQGSMSSKEEAIELINFPLFLGLFKLSEIGDKFFLTLNNAVFRTQNRVCFTFLALPNR